MMTADNMPTCINESKFPGNTAAFKRLKQALAEGSVVGFTGAGTSAPLLPTWAGALSILTNNAHADGLLRPDDYKACLDQIDRDPLDLAATLEGIITRESFRSKVSKLFCLPNSTYTAIHDHIINLSIDSIVTLNYDNGLESAYVKKCGRLPTVIRNNDHAELVRWAQNRSSRDELSIIHLHGTTSSPADMIFTSDDYHNFYSTRRFSEFVSQLWQLDRLLIVGFGFSDPFLTMVAESVLRTLPSDSRHFALIGKKGNDSITPIARQQFIKKYRLTPIFYEIRQSSDDAGKLTEDHADLEVILKALLSPEADPTGIAPTSPSSTPTQHKAGTPKRPF